MTKSAGKHRWFAGRSRQNLGVVSIYTTELGKKSYQTVGSFRNFVTYIFLMVQAPGFIRGINPKSQIENPQAPAFIRGVNLKSKI